MGESVFEWTRDLMMNTDPNYIRFEHHISMNRYEHWQKQFTWDSLQNEQRYGQSFCNYFDIQDNLLYYERDQGRADAYIRRNYLTRP